MEREQRGVESPFRTPGTELSALVRGVGFKLNVADLDVLGATKSLELTKKLRTEKEQIQSLVSKLRNKQITETEFKIKAEKITKRMERIAEQYDIKFQKIASPRDILPGDLKESLRAY
jgi:hypothetical protein